VVELIVPQGDDAYEVQLPQNGTEDGEAAEDGRWDKRISANSYVEGSFVRLVWYLSRLHIAAEETTYHHGPRRNSGLDRNAT
jgi:hypothetical protein